MSPSRPEVRPRRRYARLTLRVDVAIESPRGRCEATATTLGAGGLFVATDAPLFPATPLRVRFALPGEQTLLELEGRVVWSHEPDGGPQGPGMGVEFTDPAARSRLATILEHWATRQEAEAS